MSRADQDKWDARYRDGAYAERTHPSALLDRWLPQLRLPEGSPRAIDVACGMGRNAIYLANQGWQVDAVDISALTAPAHQSSCESSSCAGLSSDSWRSDEIAESISSSI